MASLRKSEKTISRKSDICTKTCHENFKEKSSQSSHLCKNNDTSELKQNITENGLETTGQETRIEHSKELNLNITAEGTNHQICNDIVTLEREIDAVRETLSEMKKSCSENIEQSEDKEKIVAEIQQGVDDEFKRIQTLMTKLIESVKQERISQYEVFIDDLPGKMSKLEQNIKTVDKISNDLASYNHSDLSSKQEMYMKQLENCKSDLHLPSFDIRGQSEVYNLLMKSVQSEEEKKAQRQRQEDAEELREEKDYLENAFRIVMTLLQSVVDKGENAQFHNLPALSSIKKKSLRTKMKKRHKADNDRLKYFKNFMETFIEKKQKADVDEASKDLINTTDTHEKTAKKAESGNQTDQAIANHHQLESQNIIDDWINICHKKFKECNVDQADLKIPPEQALDETTRERLKATKKKLKGICKQHIKIQFIMEDWIDICYNSFKKNEVDQVQLNMPSEQPLSERTRKKFEDSKMKLEDICRQLLKSRNELKFNTDRMKQLESEMSERSKQLKEKEQEARTAVLDRDKTLTRLSEIAGSRLKENNPMIADLSDEYRPTKLGEKFGELYDNEWTSAFLNITTKFKMTEKDAIVQLLMLLEIPEFRKKVKDFQKQMTPHMLIVVMEVLKSRERDTEQKFGRLLKVCENYTYSCIELCWIMNVQDPPMVLILDEKRGEKINTKLFRCYTKSGRSTDFMVWPAMLLHKDGALIQRGVVQPQ